MKTLLFVLCLVTLFACNSSKDQVMDYAPGIYAHASQDEFTKSSDTLVIVAPSETGSQVFEITHIQYYQQTIEGKKLTPVSKKAHWVGTYDRDDRTILIGKKGQLISFYPDKNQLKWGSAVYKKLK